MITSPGRSVGASRVSPWNSYSSRFIAPSITPGRVQPVMAQGGDEGPGVAVAEGRMVDKARLLNGHPVVLAMFVFGDVSLMKPRRVNALRMNGWRPVIQIWRAGSRTASARGLASPFVGQPALLHEA
ncbi:hypothetical protein, partial [Paracoccus rhizosphaerae]